MANSQPLRVKIVYLWPLPLRLPRYAMQRARALSFIVAKAINGSALPQPNGCQVCEIQFQWELR
jgi:hypothetical protein